MIDGDTFERRGGGGTGSGSESGSPLLRAATSFLGRGGGAIGGGGDEGYLRKQFAAGPSEAEADGSAPPLVDSKKKHNSSRGSKVSRSEGSMLSTGALDALLQRLARATCNRFMVRVGAMVKEEGEQDGHGNRINEGDDSNAFSEWGAMLIHQEVSKTCILFSCLKIYMLTSTSILFDFFKILSVISLFEGTSEAACVPSTRPRFVPILWALKLLTIDHPGLCTQYPLPRKFFAEDKGRGGGEGLEHQTIDEHAARNILQRRVEFTRESVARASILYSD